MKKKQATKEILERLERLLSVLNAERVDWPEFYGAERELRRLRKEYDLFDVVFEENGKMGIRNILGRTLVPAIYCGFFEIYPVDPFVKPVPACDSNGKYALVECNGNGTPLCPFEYDLITFMRGSSNFYICGKGNEDGMLYGVIDSKGNIVVPCEMNEVENMYNGCAMLYCDMTMGFLTIDGKYIEPQFDNIEEEGSFIRAVKFGAWSYFDTNGVAIDAKRVTELAMELDMHAKSFDKEAGKWFLSI